jgi:membrane-bound lytic murein transglycosylase D
LAITAYNHGEAGMQRAVRKMGSTDIVRIINGYDGRSFGFASRNFYAQFLAARRIASAHEKHFGKLRQNAPVPTEHVTLPFYTDVRHLQKYLGLKQNVISTLNPALRPSIFRAEKRIPRNYVLRVPKGTFRSDPDQWLAAIPRQYRYRNQIRNRYYKVRRGDTLSGIAKAHRVKISSIVSLNGLSNRHKIYPGQKLELMGSGRRIKHAASATGPAPVKVALRPKPVAARKLSTGGGSATVDRAAARETKWRRVKNDRVIVDTGETLGHFASWLGVSSQRLREINNLSRRHGIRIGQRLRLDFSRVRQKDFLDRRIAYHRAVEADFFDNYRVTGTVQHTLKPGENLWVLAHKIYSVPSWLLHRYNPSTDFRSMAPGSRLEIPVVEPQATS